jgi:hypothetical protein
MYLQNKYTRWYYNIILGAQTRTISGYTEKHHIIPRSLGGSNAKDNLVALTAREHFICHLLLTRMTHGQNKNKMISAVFYLTGKGKRTETYRVVHARTYAILKEELRIIVGKQQKGRKRPIRSDSTKEKLKLSKTGLHNPNFKNKWITPWGTFESSRLAAIHCPNKISSVTILNFCQLKNKTPISFLSFCRGKGYIKFEHVGKTPFDLGFDIV